MRPHRLRVQAFGAFAATEQVAFDDLEGLFLLHGETGAGKTTLLDAIAFALYGRVPGERGTAKRLRSDHAAPGLTTEVELEATIGGRQLRITRRPEQDRQKKSGVGFTREQAAVRLDERTASGGWENKSVRVVEADQEIKDLMGMSAEQFFQVVLLPQGQFAQFLQAKAQEKEELLRKLFGTDRFRRVEDWLAERRRATATEVEAATEVVSHLVARVAQAAGVPVPDYTPTVLSRLGSGDASDPWQAAWAASLAAKALADTDGAAALVVARKDDLDRALDSKSAAEQLAVRQRRRSDALQRQADSQAAAHEIELLRAETEAASRAAEVAPVLDAAERGATAASSARHAEDKARALLPDLPSDEPGALRFADAGVIRAASQEQQEQAGHLEALRAVERQAIAEDKAAEDARNRASRRTDDLKNAEDEATRRVESRPQALDARDAASWAATEVPAAQAKAVTSHRVATNSAELVRERAKRERLRETHVTAREKAVGLREGADDLRRARIDGMAAELALTMTDDSPCPVCGSFDHPSPVEPTFEPVSREREDAANAMADEAAQDAERAGQQVAAASAVIDSLVRSLAEDGFAVVGDRRAGATAAGNALPGSMLAVPIDVALANDPEALAAAARQAQADAQRLGAEASRLQSAAASLGDLQRKLDDLDKAITADQTRLVELHEQRTAALAEAEAAAERAADRRSELRAQLGAAPDLNAALRSARHLADAMTRAADAADDAARAAYEARDAADRAVRAATDAGFATIEAARSAFRDQSRRRETAERIKHHEAEAQAVADLLADPDLDVALDPAAPVAETTAAAEAAQHEYSVATGRHATARHTAEELAKLRPVLEDKLAALAPLQQHADQIRQLADLANGQGANVYRMTLSSFVLAARLEEVAAAASERLRTMTAGRYSLAHSDARKGNNRAGLSLLACDSWTGVDRDTATLSGGETFLASLALALGLADVVTAEAAGTPMEALFVDEGFGTLDEETLDEVMNVLDGLRAGGRIVGIVSHVTELRQRVPAQVHVAKGRHGSHVTVTVG